MGVSGTIRHRCRDSGAPVSDCDPELVLGEIHGELPIGQSMDDCVAHQLAGKQNGSVDGLIRTALKDQAYKTSAARNLGGSVSESHG